MGQKHYVGSVISGSEAQYLLSLTREYTDDILYITHSLEAEEKLLKDIYFYLHKHPTYQHLKVLHFPHYETLFYDFTTISEHILSKRIQTLHALTQHTGQKLIITNIETILYRTVPRSFVSGFNLHLSVGDSLDTEQFSQNVSAAGYLRVNKVLSKLDFAVRGSIIDIFPAGSKQPLRIDLFDTEIEDIRLFDIETQRSIKKVNQFSILSAREFSFDAESRKQFIAQYLTEFTLEDDFITAVQNGQMPEGIESYLPLFYKQMECIFDYLDSAIICTKEALSARVDNLSEQITSAYNRVTTKPTHTVLPPNTLFLAKEELFQKLNQFEQVVIRQYVNEDSTNFSCSILPSVQLVNNSFKLLQQYIQQTNIPILIVCASNSRMSTLIDILSEVTFIQCEHYADFVSRKTTGQVYLTLGEVSESIVLPDQVIISETSIFGNTLSAQTRKRRAKHKDFISSIKTIIEIEEGDLIVHENYGIGKYLGLQTLELDATKQDLIRLEYAGGSKLMVPIDEIGLLSKYAGASSQAHSLNKLGTKNWKESKAKALKEMYDIASELLALYAKRTLATGYRIDTADSEFETFSRAFPFVETEDQITAINDVIRDLESDIPMDRLICGDVGFGKTEVAMRAAFLVVASGYQVAILTPTTLLASQHYKSFVERFHGFAVNIEELSRFKTSKEQSLIKAQLKAGIIDIVIGTHKLLQKDIEYQNLGMVIIDEEHRFGVRQKESLKQVKNKCNILSMSATPIPRTLSLSLNELRSMSVIATPPMGRSKVRTFVKLFDTGIIREAIEREIHRNGQVFFVHNDIDTIDKIADTVEQTLVHLSVRIAHGRMSTRELELIMSDFYHKRFQVLVCTTIIETGIDVPNANTIIINNANKFGLSGLHQLRGRVGRSTHQAFAYLLVPSFETIGENANKRLEAIQSLEDIGSGFNLATHDLEIRGAGDILGKNQSGKITEIGYGLYYDLLHRTIESVRANQDITEVTVKDLDINLGVSAIIPSDYVFDVHTRLEFYAKIAQSLDLTEVKMELIDRFGFLPEETKNLFAVNELKAFCKEYHISSVNAFSDRVLVEFDSESPVDFPKVISLIQTHPKEYKLKNNQTLVHQYDELYNIERIERIQQLLHEVIII